MATYNPHKLVDHVRELMQDAGVEMQPTDERMALIGASQILRSVGVFPAMDAADFDSSIRRIWSGRDRVCSHIPQLSSRSVG